MWQQWIMCYITISRSRLAMCNIKVSHLSILLGLKDESNKCLSLRVKRASYTYQMCFFWCLILIPTHCLSVVTNPVNDVAWMRTVVYIGILYYCPMITLLLKSLKCNASLKSVVKNNAKGYHLEPPAHYKECP